MEGDAKLYAVLQSLKFEYWHEYRWLLPMPGDWHLLKNFQIALMKPYFEAGLKELARVSGYPVEAIQTCSKFKRTHYFILEAWESIYQVMMGKYFQYYEACPDLHDEEIIATVKTALQKVDNNDYDATSSIADLQKSLSQLKFYDSFLTFLNEASLTNSTWKFCSQFVLQDGLAYVSLFIAIRSGNWDLRCASLKMMAPIFSAFDHQTYKILIADNLADVLILPKYILDNLKQGCFTVSLNGRP